mgnify:CR=1 FL=1|jgi:hypothetical protein|tara:strand:+ start:719 stop:946 length:228 start_codon:yes stop_codon:yes gene_type:complete
MAFQVNKQHKLQDQIESMCYEWAEVDVMEYFEVEAIEDLTQEQVDEIRIYADSDECYEGMVGVSLRYMCDQWDDQ